VADSAMRLTEIRVVSESDDGEHWWELSQDGRVLGHGVWKSNDDPDYQAFADLGNTLGYLIREAAKGAAERTPEGAEASAEPGRRGTVVELSDGSMGFQFESDGAIERMDGQPSR
jgi:hypothetical protein